MAYEKFMLYIYSHLLGGWVVLTWVRIRNIEASSYVFKECLHLLGKWVFVLRWVRGRYVLHISLCIFIFLMWHMMDLYEVREWGFFSFLIFSFIMFTMSCNHVCIVIECIIFAYILHILSFTLKNFLSFYSFIWGNGQKHDSLCYNIFTTIFCGHLHIKSMQ